METKNNLYWKAREMLKYTQTDKELARVEKELEKIYNDAIKDIKKDIASLFERYAEDNSLTYLEASKYLTGAEYKEFRMSLAEYILEIESTGNQELLLELNTVAMKSRIQRLEELCFEINKKVNNVAIAEYDITKTLLKDTVTSNYYQTIFNIQQYTGVGAIFTRLNNTAIESIVNYPWSGANFSERIWNRNTKKLKPLLKQELTQMFIQGKDLRSVSKRIAEKMESSYEAAIRLVRTEHAYMAGEATAMGYEETDVEEYEILATLDINTSEKCRKLDGKVFKLKDKEVNVNYPPLHVNCRTTTVPYFEDDEDIEGETRTERVPGGKTYEVPADMKYEDWYDKYVNKINVDDEIAAATEDSSDIISNKKWLTANFSSKKRFESHLKHLSEYDNISPEEYLDIGRGLLSAELSEDVEGFISNQGWLFKYRKSTNDFVVGHPKGTISTLFKPNDGYEYYLREKEKNK